MIPASFLSAPPTNHQYEPSVHSSHTPATHLLRGAFLPQRPQYRSQRPQWLVLVWVSTHRLPQRVRPLGHVQTPLWHVVALGPAWPHAPQLKLSVTSPKAAATGCWAQACRTRRGTEADAAEGGTGKEPERRAARLRKTSNFACDGIKSTAVHLDHHFAVGGL
jgi:hypothetical protein